eukprot:jgi/Psemu1/36336/gm1.36336_g
MRLKGMEMTKKKASTETHQAFTAENLRKLGSPRGKFINVNKFGVSIQQRNNTYGFALKCYRVRKPQPYIQSQKLLFPIKPGDSCLPPDMRGSITKSWQWTKAIQTVGTSIFVFVDFIDLICRGIKANPAAGDFNTNATRIFLWDNLGIHLAPIVAQTMEVQPPEEDTLFHSIQCPPYQPKYGPMEYEICKLVEIVSRITKPD